MFEINELVNTCYAQTQAGTVISFAAYAHLLPSFMMFPLALFILIKSKFNFFAKTFFAFVTAFCLWLLGDHILWTSNNYDLIHTVWAFLDYIEIIFFIFGLYFILVFLRERDVSITTKGLLFVLALPALVASFIGYSTTAFYHPLCESLNSNFITYYKLIVEAFIVGIILINLIIHIFRKYNKQDKKADIVVMSTIFVMLAGWGVTEYLASSTGNYEIHLYAMFSLPIFVVILVYSVFELDIFHFKLLGTHYLVAGLVLLMGGQLFFVESGIDSTLTLVTFSATVFIAAVLFFNLKKEADQRKHIENISVLLRASKDKLSDNNLDLEKTNQRLRVLDKMKTEFLSLASHQLRSPLTAIKGYSSMLSDGDFGALNDKQKEAINRIFKSSKHLTVVVEDLLNVAKIEQGGMQYVMKVFDLEKVSEDLIHDLQINAKEKNLSISFVDDGQKPYLTKGDMEKLRQVMMNFIDNSIKYTKEGYIEIGLRKDIARKKVIFYVKDTGMGISNEIKDTLFQKFARGMGGKMDATGSGLGLYLAKEVVEAHSGNVWVESPGIGKGSTFFMELVLA